MVSYWIMIVLWSIVAVYYFGQGLVVSYLIIVLLWSKVGG